MTSDLSAHSSHPGGHVQSDSRLFSRVSDATVHQKTVSGSVFKKRNEDRETFFTLIVGQVGF